MQNLDESVPCPDYVFHLKNEHEHYFFWSSQSCVRIQPVLSTCPLPANSGCGKREAHIDWSMVTYQGSTRLELP